MKMPLEKSRGPWKKGKKISPRPIKSSPNVKFAPKDYSKNIDSIIKNQLSKYSGELPSVVEIKDVYNDLKSENPKTTIQEAIDSVVEQYEQEGLITY